MTIIKRYSIAFKQKVIREYEAGASLRELGRKYGIGGATTVQKWVNKYGQAGVRHKQMVIQDPSDQEKTKQLKQRVGQLEKLVAQLMLDKVMLESTLEAAEARLGDGFKKSGGAK